MPSHPSRRAFAATAVVAVCALALTPLSAASAAVVPDPISHSAADASLALAPLGSFDTGVFDESAAEIVTAHGDRLFVVNALAGSVSVLDYSDPTAITPVSTLNSDGVANSVAVRADGLGVIAFEAPVKTDPGHLVFFDADAAEPVALGEVEVGALPDMVSISKDGAYVVSANEGEPSDEFDIDPEGSISIVSLPSAVAAPTQSAVRTADFHAFEAGGTKTLPADVRIFGPTPHGDDLPVSRNLEPEYIAIEGGVAYAALQEANAVAVVDLAAATVTDIWPLGFKDHGVTGNGIDASDRDPNGAPTFNIQTYPGLYGVYMPDGLVSYTAGGHTYLVSANEGDAREWGSYVEPIRAKDLGKDGVPAVCSDSPLATSLKDPQLGRLNVTRELGLDEAKGCYSALYAFGGRSFSIWTTTGEQVFDSGDEFERITQEANPAFFNSNHTEANLEGRSDDKGPEPENLAIGRIGDRTYAFIGFERVGGVAVYDISTPTSARFVTYVNNRDFTVDQTTAAAGDLGAEGLAFIPAETSTTGRPLLAVANEVSGTTTLFSITDLLAPVNTAVPTITGTPALGQTLTATTGVWDAANPTFAYEWLRDGQPIARATGAAYKVTAADLGRVLAVRVTATAAGATASAESAPVTVLRPSVATVVASPTLATTRTAVTTTVRIIASGDTKATGTVTVRVAGRTFSATAVNGVAKVAVGKLPRGLHVITASYAGDTAIAPTVGLGLVIVL